MQANGDDGHVGSHASGEHTFTQHNESQPVQAPTFRDVPQLDGCSEEDNQVIKLALKFFIETPGNEMDYEEVSRLENREFIL